MAVLCAAPAPGLPTDASTLPGAGRFPASQDSCLQLRPRACPSPWGPSVHSPGALWRWPCALWGQREGKPGGWAAASSPSVRQCWPSSYRLSGIAGQGQGVWPPPSTQVWGGLPFRSPPPPFNWAGSAMLVAQHAVAHHPTPGCRAADGRCRAVIVSCGWPGAWPLCSGGSMVLDAGGHRQAGGWPQRGS